MHVQKICIYICVHIYVDLYILFHVLWVHIYVDLYILFHVLVRLYLAIPYSTPRPGCFFARRFPCHDVFFARCLLIRHSPGFACVCVCVCVCGIGYIDPHICDLRLENRNAVATSGKKNVFRRRKNRNLSLRCGSPNASPEVVHRPRSQSPLHFDIGNI